VLRWTLLVGAVFTLVLLPFLLFGERMEAWTAAFLHTGAERPGAVAAVIVLLLAGDLFLPVPSSLVGTAAGYFLGFVGGTLTSLVGMTAGSLLAYALGKGSGRSVARRFIPPSSPSRGRCSSRGWPCCC
jgi:uncharacterized membrane protein YdjX (TVP38/TMEM64 family)